MLEDLGMDEDVSCCKMIVSSNLSNLSGWGGGPSAQCECCHPEEGDPVGHLSQGEMSQMRGASGSRHNFENFLNLCYVVCFSCVSLILFWKQNWGLSSSISHYKGDRIIRFLRKQCKIKFSGWPPTPRGRREQGEENRWHFLLGRKFPQGWPRHSLWADLGSQLPRYQGAPWRHIQDCGQHDQGKDTGGDQEDIQHQECLYPKWGGASAKGERVVRGEEIRPRMRNQPKTNQTQPVGNNLSKNNLFLHFVFSSWEHKYNLYFLSLHRC